MQKCGFCSMVSGLLRRAMCVRSRRGSSESYYRELGDQDTLKIEDRSSDLSDYADEEIHQEEQPGSEPPVLLLRCTPQPGPAPPPPPEPASPPIELEEKLPEIHDIKCRNLSAGRFLTIHKRRKKRLLTRSLSNDSALLDDISFGQVNCILEQSVYWPFNAFALENVSGGRCLPVLCVHLFHIYGLISYFKLDAAKTWKLFSLIEEGYHSTNPYHNSIHAADVTQAMHCFLQQKQIRAHLEPLEIMASLLAAIAHDLDHPGVNQSFLSATSNHLAALYRNTSVLENHHWRAAVSCLIQSGILDQMEEVQGKLQNQMSALILATDITRQQEYLSQFKGHMDTNTLDLTKSEHRLLVLQIALKCADISNPCRPWEISRKWSLKVCEEFFRQGDYERKLNLPVTELCDRHTTSIPKIQKGFLKFVVTPLITEWHRFLQNDLSSQMLTNLHYNQNKWETLVAEEAAQETRTEISDADLVEDDLETCISTNLSDSSEMLLPLRRCSLNTTKQSGIKEQLRRFSVPLNIFQDSKFKNKGRSTRASSLAEPHSCNAGSDCPMGSEHSLHSQLSVRGHCDHKKTSDKVLSSEKLLPDSSIASITTPIQASRLSTVLKDGIAWKLVRQQTFPPLETTREHSLVSRPLHTSNEDAIFSSRYKMEYTGIDPSTCKEARDALFSSLFVKTVKTGSESASLAIEGTSAMPFEKENKFPKGRRESATGSQLRDNLTSVQLGLHSDPLLHRRKSMPADVVLFTPKEKKVREALPELLRRTLSGKDSWTRRRGSAPSPIASSELRGLASLGSLRHSVNGGRRKPNPIVTCQQWLAKTSYSVQERAYQQLPRRSSLPVEVYHRISSPESK